MLLQVLLGLLLTLGLSVLLEPALDAISMPMLFLPLTVTLFAFLLAGKARGSGIALVPVWLLRSPEDNVRLYMNRKKPVLQLPFFGTWFVSQGIDGGETHKGSLAHAWDFMVRDERGRTFAAPGYRLADYRAFGLQVAAPAPGKVVAIENGVPDNPPGRLNREQNWGNYVIIEHSFFEYSILAHLQHGSVRVRTGERVSAGAVIGACGNSGYSGQPHLHYQLQNAGLPGSDALTADFHNYLVLTGAGVRFIRSGRPTQDQTIQPLLPQDNIRQLFLSGLAGERRFVVQRGAVTDSETWSFEGHGAEFTALSLGTKLLLREEREGLVVVWVHGSRQPCWRGLSRDSSSCRSSPGRALSSRPKAGPIHSGAARYCRAGAMPWCLNQ